MKIRNRPKNSWAHLQISSYFGVFWGKIQLSSGHKVSWFGFGRKIFPGNSLPHVRLSSMPFWICGINFLKIFHFSRQGKHQHKFPKVWQIDENITKMQILHKHILVSFLLLFFNILLIIFFFHHKCLQFWFFKHSVHSMQ